jgi:two-component system response regulator WspF
MNIGIVSAIPEDVAAIRRALAYSAQHVVMWQAASVNDACELCARELPELVLMDLFAPECGGAEGTRRIMAATPCAILLLASDIGTYASQVFEAMGQGALDAVDTPHAGPAAPRVNAAAFLHKLDDVSRRMAVPRAAAPALAKAATGLVAIGASAGGPAALRTLLGGMPANFPAALVIIQHLDQRFAPGLVAWLSEFSTLPMRLAREDDVPEAGLVLLAGTNDHLVLKSRTRLGYTSDPVHCVYRPSVDVFFQSIMGLWQGPAAGVLLSGMGRDGALGLKGLRDQGHHTIAQDLASSAVYGMPKAAVEIGGADETLAVGAIAARLVELVRNDRWRAR